MALEVPEIEHQAWPRSAARLAVYDRQGGLCARCWENVGREEFEAHHRLRIGRMRDPYRWCPCDLVALHPRCHTQGPLAVHDHPEEANGLGLILWDHQDPREVPIQVTWPWSGLGYLDCDSMLVSPLVAVPEVVPRKR